MKKAVITYLAALSLITPSLALQVEGGEPVKSESRQKRDVRQQEPAQTVTVLVSAAGDSVSRTRVDEFCGYLATDGVQGIADTSSRRGQVVPADIVRVTLTFGRQTTVNRSGNITYRNDEGRISRTTGTSYQAPISVSASAPGLFWGTTQVARGTQGSTTVEVHGVGSIKRPSGSSIGEATSSTLQSLAKETAEHVRGYTPQVSAASSPVGEYGSTATSPTQGQRLQVGRPVYVRWIAGGWSCTAPAGTYSNGQTVGIWAGQQFRFNTTIRWEGNAWRFDRQDLVACNVVR